jgi:hypothetical protein
MVKDPAKKLGKFVVHTWDGIYLRPNEGGDDHYQRRWVKPINQTQLEYRWLRLFIMNQYKMFCGIQQNLHRAVYRKISQKEN